MIPAHTIRAAPASLVGYVGTVIADNNMLDYSTDFTKTATSQYSHMAAAWGLDNTTVVTAGQPARPDGTAGQKLTENGANSIHAIDSFDGPLGTSNLTEALVNVTYRLAFIARPSGRTRCVGTITIWNALAAIDKLSAGFDLSGATSFDNTADAGWTFQSATARALGNGWVLCTLDGFFTHAPAIDRRFFYASINLDDGAGAAARSTTYAGDGASGIELWWISLMPKGAWLLKRVAFLDDFNSIDTIDVNDTRADGYNWYVHNLFPNCSITDFGLVTNPPSAPTPVGVITVANSICRISNPAVSPNPGWESQMWSVAYTGDMGGGPTGYKGNVFALPAFFESSFALDQTTRNLGGGAGNTAFWGQSIEALTGVENTLVEVDHAESSVGANNVGSGMHMSTGPTIATVPNAHGATGSAIFSFWNPNLVAADYEVQNRYGSLLIDAASNGGSWGIHMFFFRGLYTSGTMVFSATDTSIQPSAPNPVGAYATLSAGQHLTIFHNTQENPAVWMDIDYTRVFTP